MMRDNFRPSSLSFSGHSGYKKKKIKFDITKIVLVSTLVAFSCIIGFWVYYSSLKLLLLLLSGFLGFILIFMNPILGIFSIAIVDPFQWMYYLPRFMSFSRSLTSLLAFSWFVHRSVSRNRVGVRKSVEVKWLLLLIISIVLSFVFSYDKNLAYLLSGRFILALVLYFITVDLVTSLKRVRILLWCISVSTGVLSVFGLLNYWAGGTLFHYAYEPSKATLYSSIPRLGGFVGDPNGFALELLAGIAVTLFLVTTSKSLFVRFILIFFICVSIVDILLSASRTGVFILLLFPVLYIIFLYYGRKKTINMIRFIKSLVMPIFLVLIIFIAYTHYAGSAIIAREQIMLSGSDESIEGRLDCFKSGMEMFLDHPLFGIGLGNFSMVHQNYYANDIRYSYLGPHNMYLQVLSESGLLGFISFLAIIIISIKNLFYSIKNVKYIEDSNKFDAIHICWAVLLCIVVYLIAGFALTVTYAKYFWIMLALSSSLKNLVYQGKVELIREA